MTELSPKRAALGPVRPGERIELLDVLRGFALIGVLYVNMHNFGAWEVERGGVLVLADFLMGALFERKFYTLFSLLFGIGFTLLFFKSLRPRQLVVIAVVLLAVDNFVTAERQGYIDVFPTGAESVEAAAVTQVGDPEEVRLALRRPILRRTAYA